MSYTVAQNTSFLTSASILQKVISFAYFTLIARFIGVENTGQYFFAIAFTTIFTVVADFGMGPVLTREAAKYPENSEKYLNTVFWTKIIFGLSAYLLVVFFVNILNYPPITKDLIYLSGLTMFFDNLHSVFYSIFRARKNLIYESIGVIGSQFITLIIGTIALLSHWPIISLIAAYTIPAFLNFLYSAYFARKVYKLKYSFAWNREIFKMFFYLAVPFALAGIIGRLYSYSDTLLISKFLDQKDMGLWSVPYKITFAFQFIPSALAASVYPAMSGFYLSDKAKVGELFEKSWRYLFLIVFPLSFGLFVLAKPVIIYLYGPNFALAAEVLKILLMSLIFGFLSFITGSLLNAVGKQSRQTALLGAALTVNIILNLILLPIFGIKGAAVSALAGNITLCLGGFYFTGREIIINYGRLFKFLNQYFWPALFMAAAVYFISSRFGFFLSIPAGMIIYCALVFVSGGVDKEIIKRVLQKVIKNSNVKKPIN
ncbi:MAG: flippase [Patescibacteria group bacterium]|nr:flippase [Patescibacteria group bacterium]